MDPLYWNRRFYAVCERTGLELWTEPFNVASNLGFLLVALLAARALARRERLDGTIVGLALLALLIGVGSALFHIYATRWSLWLDRTPIQAFVVAYVLVAARRFLGLGIVGALFLTALVAYGAQTYVEATPWRIWNGYARYVAPLAIILGFAVVVTARGWAPLWRGGVVGAEAHATGLRLFAASGVLAAALAFAANDRSFCAVSPIGLHWVWHLLTALVLHILIDAALRMGPRSAVRIAQAGPAEAGR